MSCLPAADSQATSTTPLLQAQGKHLAQQADASAAGGLPIRHELLAPETERQQADALRAATCDELLARRAEVEPFIEGDFETYVDGMRAPSVWGGEPRSRAPCCCCAGCCRPLPQRA